MIHRSAVHAEAKHCQAVIFGWVSIRVKDFFGGHLGYHPVCRSVVCRDGGILINIEIKQFFIVSPRP